MNDAVNGQMSPEEVREALTRNLRSIAAAYPEDIFPPITAQEREAHDLLIGRVSAQMGRHLGQFLIQAADEIERLRGCLSEESSKRQAWAPTITAALKALGVETDTGDLSECVRGIERAGKTINYYRDRERENTRELSKRLRESTDYAELLKRAADPLRIIVEDLAQDITPTAAWRKEVLAEWAKVATQSSHEIGTGSNDQRRPAAIQQGGNGVPLSDSSGPRGSDAKSEAPSEGVSGATNPVHAVGHLHRLPSEVELMAAWNALPAEHRFVDSDGAPIYSTLVYYEAEKRFLSQYSAEARCPKCGARVESIGNPCPARCGIESAQRHSQEKP